MAATTFALPKELNERQRRELASGFAAGVTEGERLPYTLAVHRGDGENPHAHLMISERAERVEKDNEALVEERNGLIERIKESIAGIYQELQALPEKIRGAGAGVGPWGRVQPVRTSQFPSRKGPERRGPKRGGLERDYGPSRVKFLPHGFSRAFTFVRRRATKFRSSKARNPTHSSTARDGVILMTAGGKFRMTVRTYR